MACLSTIGMVSPGGVVSGASVVADVSVPSVGIELSCVGFVGVSGSFWLHPSTETESVSTTATVQIARRMIFFGSFHS